MAQSLNAGPLALINAIQTREMTPKNHPRNPGLYRVVVCLFAILLCALPFAGGCSSPPPDDKGSLNGKTTDGKPVPPEAMNAPAAPGGLEAPPGGKGLKGKK